MSPRWYLSTFGFGSTSSSSGLTSCDFNYVRKSHQVLVPLYPFSEDFAERSSLDVEALLGRFLGLPQPCLTPHAIFATFMHSTIFHLAACRPSPHFDGPMLFFLSSPAYFALFPSSRFSGPCSFKSFVSPCSLVYNRMVVAGGDCLSFLCPAGLL